MRMSNQLIRVGTLLCCAVLSVSMRAGAQLPRSSMRIFVPRLEGGPDSSASDIVSLARLLMQFELVRLPFAERINDTAPACDDGSQQVTTASSTRAVDFFIVRVAAKPLATGTVEVESDLEHCSVRGLQRVYHEDASLRVEDVASDVPLMARRIAERISYEARTPVAVAVSGTLDGLDAKTVRRTIDDVLRLQPTLRPTDSSSADTVLANLTSGARSVAFGFAGPTFIELVPLKVTTIPERETEATAKLSRALLTHLRIGLYGATTKEGAKVDLPRDSALARVADALCFDNVSDCRPDAAAASLALRAMHTPIDAQRADVEQLTDIDIVTAIAYTRLRADDRGGAFEALKRALALAPGNPRPTLPQSTQALLKRALGDLYLAEGNYSAALDQYEALLTAAPRDTGLQVKIVRTLRAAGRPYDAFRRATSFGEGMAPTLQTLALDVLEDVQPAELSSHIDEARQRCNDAGLSEKCADLFDHRGAVLRQSGRTSEQVQRLYATQTLQSLSDTARRIDAAVARAAAALGTVVFPYRSGRLSIQASGTRQAVITSSLATVDSLLAGHSGRDSLLARVRASRELAVRIRAILEALAGDYDSARRGAAQADSLLPNPAAVTLQLQLAYAGYTRAKDATDSATRRGPARALLDTALARYPKDDAVLTMASMVCGEFDVDFACAYRAAEARMKYGRHLETRPRLELIEAAILADRFEKANDWIDDLKIAKPDYCERSLSSFFDYWAEAARNHPDHAKRGLEAWESANRSYWSLPGSNGPCWSFGGVTRKLAGMNGSPLKSKLSEMLTAMIQRPTSTPAPAPAPTR
jgi:tetratricopeptide (TPR) repeat protein